MTSRTDHLANLLASSGGRIGLLDPACIGVSPLDPRHADAMYGAGFSALKDNIAQTAGNLVPILVRPLEAGALELVYGRRRLQVCLELGLPVQAIVQSLGTREAFETMVRVCRPAWSLYEAGDALKRCLDAGLYPSMRRVAQACGLGLAEAALAHTVATWPTSILGTFATPTSISPVVAKAIQRAMARDLDGVLRRAEAAARGLPVSKALVALRGPKP